MNKSVMSWNNSIIICDGNTSLDYTLVIIPCDNIRRRTAQPTYQKIQAQCLKEQRRNYIHTFKKWKVRNHSDNRLSYRTFRVRPLLDNNFYSKAHHLSRLWNYDQSNQESNFVPRRCVVQCLRE